MAKKSVIHFSDFIKDKITTNESFNKDDFNDFFLEENMSQPELDSEENYDEEPGFIDVEESEPGEFYEDEAQEEEEEEDDDAFETEELVESSKENFYTVYKDKSEDFSCDIQLEGANLDDTQARLILESKEWTLMFNGEIDRKGKCIIPIKKLGILNEGTVGKIRLEVIAEGTVFTPWEDEFKVKASKKVAVKIHESRSNPRRPQPKSKGVKVRVNR